MENSFFHLICPLKNILCQSEDFWFLLQEKKNKRFLRISKLLYQSH